MILDALTEWWSRLFGEGGVTESGWYFISALIVFVLLGLALVIVSAVLKRVVHDDRENKATISELTQDMTAVKMSRETAIRDSEKAKTDLESLQLTLDMTKRESEGKDARVHAYEKIFKEALMIADSKSDIAIDKSEVLDVMSVGDVKEYAASIGAKATSSMTKDEMISSVRAREISLKSMANARKASADKKKAKASDKKEEPEAVAEPYVSDQRATDNPD